jgi:hypothetical protein
MRFETVSGDRARGPRPGWRAESVGKVFLSETLCDLCVSVVKSAGGKLHHRGTEVTQRTTEFFPDRLGSRGR